MKKLLVALLAVVLGGLLTLPLTAQTPSTTGHGGSGSSWRVSPPRPSPRGGFNFLPGFGLRPVLSGGYPVFGQGFDAQHYALTHGFNGSNSFSRFHRSFRGRIGFGGGYYGTNFYAGGYYGAGYYPSYGGTNVVVVPQVIPVAVPTELRPQYSEPPVVVLPGLPDDWPRLRVAEASYPKQPPPLAPLTLVVLKNQKIFAVSDYWLEDARLFYVTSTGRQDSVALHDLDLEMTNQLNAERNVDFVLRSPR